MNFIFVEFIDVQFNSILYSLQDTYIVPALLNIPRNRLFTSLPPVPSTFNTFVNGHEFLSPETNRAIHRSVLQFVKHLLKF